MARITGLVAALFMASCATVQPYKTSVLSTKQLTEVFDCALRGATSLELHAGAGEPRLGVFRAEHNYSPGPASIHWGTTMTDQFTILVTKDSATAQQQLQVT